MSEVPDVPFNLHGGAEEIVPTSGVSHGPPYLVDRLPRGARSPLSSTREAGDYSIDYDTAINNTCETTRNDIHDDEGYRETASSSSAFQIQQDTFQIWKRG